MKSARRFNGIIGMNHIAMHHLEDPERVSDCLNKIDMSSRHLLALLNDVLDMSKVESGKIELCPEKISMKMILEQMMVIASSQAADKNIAFHVESSVDDSLVVLGDSLRISQIISNLFPMPLNSRKRADRSGSGSGKKSAGRQTLAAF